TEITFNVDDMTAEQLAYACQKILSGGAREVFTTPVVMKKGRLGSMVTVLCDPSDVDKIADLVFKNTSTIGVRLKSCDRIVLVRSMSAVITPARSVAKKTSLGRGAKKTKYEYDDVSAVADKLNCGYSAAEEYIKKFDK
ncbi:MAG: DUF111 family protein, partial [Clostridia bacterium]|nr:DUF111 family protein [Clostridia bacterium]